MIDAAAIAEAATRPTMRLAEVKRPDEIDLQALHRIRDQPHPPDLLDAGVLPRIRDRNRQAAGMFRSELPRIIDEAPNDLTPTMRRLLQERRKSISCASIIDLRRAAGRGRR